MSYRLDQGNGSCTYRIGVEDDGCHSLLDYGCIAETARVLECLARSLNAVVLERKIIQNEVVTDCDGSPVKCNVENRQPLFVIEPSLMGDGREQLSMGVSDGSHSGKLDEEKSTKDDLGLQIDRECAFTRAELTIQRIETHLLDPSPLSLAEIAGGDHQGDTKSGSTSNSLRESESILSATTARSRQGGDNMSIAETLSSRNIRVAVVGNVDAGKSTTSIKIVDREFEKSLTEKKIVGRSR